MGTVQSKYGAFAPDMDNKFNVARVLVGFTGDHRNIVSGIDFAEKIHDKTKNIQNDFITSAAERVTKNQDTEKTQLYADAVGNMKTKLESATKMMYGFRDGLDKASEVFPPLTIAVWAVDGAIQAAEAATWLLSIAHNVLTGSEMFDQLATWGLVTSKQAEALSEIAAAGATWLLNGALMVLDALIGPLGVILLGIVTAIAAVKFWETEHAKALETSRKELEENTARNNIAVSQYKDLKKARENETDAIKRQQAARKEAIALYELEASRIKRRKAVHDEAKLRNDAVWGEYGLRASLQKMGLGIIAGGDFQSQYENYDGTTANIRKIKEDSLGNLFATREQNYVASVYDKNSNFFAEVEAYKEPLQALYDKESKLIEQYGSIDNARASKEFYEAVKEFSDATGINGETAGKMLDWLETENKVDQATKVGQAQIGVIRARADAKVAALEYGDGGDLNDMDKLGNAMVLAQFQEMMNTAKTEVWWELLFAYLDTLVSIIVPWKWGDVGKNLATIGIRQEELSELDAEGNNILNSMYEQYENAERKDYGAGISYASDTPFGGAIASASAEYADKEQDRLFTLTGKTMSEDAYLATQDQYAEDTYGITNEKLKQQKFKEDKEAYEKNKAQKQINKSKDTLGQLQNNGEQAHQDALDIIDAIKNPGVVSGLGAGISKLFSDSLDDFLGKSSLEDIFSFMRGESGTITEKAINIGKEVKTAYAEDGFKGVYQYSKQGIKNAGNRAFDFLESKGINARPYVEKIKGTSPNAIERTKNAISRGKGIANDLLYGKEVSTGKVKVNFDGPNTPIMERQGGLIAKGQSIFNNAKAAYAEDGFRGIYNYGKEGIKGVAPNAVERAKNALARGKGLASEGVSRIKGSNIYSQATDRIALAREANALASDGVAVARSPIDKAVGAFDGAKAAYAEDGLKGLANFGKNGAEGLAAASTITSGKVSGIKGLVSSIHAESGGIKGIASTTVDGMKDLFNPKGISSGVSDVAKGIKGGGTLAKGVGELGGRALAFLGPALAFADKASELNPTETHYNEDGTEKKALQATGEVVGTTAGALGGVAGGVAGASEGAIAGAAIGSVVPVVGTAIGGAIGAVVGGVAGGWLGDTIFQPIGDAIGGTIGWLGDNLLGGIQNVAGTVWDGLTGAAGGIWDAVSGAASGAWEFLTGNGEDGKPVGGLLGMTPIGMIANTLFGNNEENDPYKNVNTDVNQEKPQKSGQSSGNTIVIKNININTEDDPEKIKSALMNLIIEMQEQISPRTVSRTVGKPISQSTSMTQNTNDSAQAEETDPQSGTNTNNNQNPTT